VTKAPPWHGLVACDTFCNNVSTGLYLSAALCELAAPAAFAPVARLAYPVALVFLLADLLLLVLDLGDPLRFHHMLRVFKPSSPMSFGVWGLTAYSFPLTAVVALDLLAGPGLDGARRAALVLGLLPALGACIYKGVLFSTSAQPGWRDARWLGGYLANSAVLLGCGGLLALSVLAGREEAAVVLRPALAVLMVLNLVPLGLLIAEIRPALARAYSRRHLQGIGAALLGAGLLVPLALLGVGGAFALVGAVLCLFLGRLVWRFVIVRLPQASH
jgi:hypothetical protein